VDNISSAREDIIEELRKEIVLRPKDFNSRLSFSEQTILKWLDNKLRKRHLFSLSKTYEEYLNEGTIDPALKKALEEKFDDDDDEIKAYAEVSQEAGGWFVLEDDKKKYWIEIAEEELKVYNRKESIIKKFEPEENVQGTYYFLKDKSKEAQKKLEDKSYSPNISEYTYESKYIEEKIEQKFEEIKKAEKKIEDIETLFSFKEMIQQLAEDYETCREVFKNDKIMEYLKSDIVTADEKIKEYKSQDFHPKITTYLNIWKTILDDDNYDDTVFDYDDLKELTTILGVIDFNGKCSKINPFKELMKEITTNIFDKHFKDSPAPKFFLNHIFEWYVRRIEFFDLRYDKGIWYELIINHIHHKENRKYFNDLIMEKVEQEDIAEITRESLKKLKKSPEYLV